MVLETRGEHDIWHHQLHQIKQIYSNNNNNKICDVSLILQDLICVSQIKKHSLKSGLSHNRYLKNLLNSSSSILGTLLLLLLPPLPPLILYPYISK